MGNVQPLPTHRCDVCSAEWFIGGLESIQLNGPRECRTKHFSSDLIEIEYPEETEALEAIAKHGPHRNPKSPMEALNSICACLNPIECISLIAKTTDAALAASDPAPQTVDLRALRAAAPEPTCGHRLFDPGCHICARTYFNWARDRIADLETASDPNAERPATIEVEALDERLLELLECMGESDAHSIKLTRGEVQTIRAVLRRAGR